MVDQSKVLFGVKKEGNQRDFFVVKGILWTKGLRIVLLAGPNRSIGGMDLLAAVQMNLDLDSRPPGVRYNPGANMPPRCLCREVIVLGQANLHAMQSMQENGMQEGFPPDCHMSV